MHIVCLFTSDYFPIYDDEHGRIHYEDDDYALYDIQRFAELSTFNYKQLTQLRWV